MNKLRHWSMILSMFLLWKYWQLSSSSSFTSLLIHSLEIHAIFWGIEAYLRRIKTSPRAVHAGSTPVASKRTNSDGSGVVPQQLIPPGALGHFFPLVTPMGGEAALSGRKRKKTSKSKRSKNSKTRKSHSAKASKATRRKKSRTTVVLKPSKNYSSSGEKSVSCSDDPSLGSQ